MGVCAKSGHGAGVLASPSGAPLCGDTQGALSDTEPRAAREGATELGKRRWDEVVQRRLNDFTGIEAPWYDGAANRDLWWKFRHSSLAMHPQENHTQSRTTPADLS